MARSHGHDQAESLQFDFPSLKLLTHFGEKFKSLVGVPIDLGEAPGCDQFPFTNMP